MLSEGRDDLLLWQGSGMSAVWAAIYSGADAALILIMDGTSAKRPYQGAVTVILNFNRYYRLACCCFISLVCLVSRQGTLFLLPTFTFISFVSLAILGDIHGSVGYALATMACIILLCGDPSWRRSSPSGSTSISGVGR